MINCKCSECDKQFRVKDNAAGKKGKCPQCRTVLQVPVDQELSSVGTSKYTILQPLSSIPNNVLDNTEDRTDWSRTDDTDFYGFPNYRRYANYTKKENWKAICDINHVMLNRFGIKKELKVLPNYLEDDEVVFALTSGIMKQTHTSNKSDLGCNSWLVVLTSERFLFLDHAFWTKSVDTQSIRHDHVQAVSASQGWLFGKVVVDIGARTVVIDNCIKETVKTIANLCNKWIAVSQKNRETVPACDTNKSASFVDEMKNLVDLHSAGVLTDEEFALAKTKLLVSK